MAPKKTWPLPKAFYPEGETNRSLARFKAARLTKWDVDRAKSLEEMYELAFSLEALGRVEEALEVASFPYGRFTYRNDGFFRAFLDGCLAEACYLAICMGRRDEGLRFMDLFREHPENAYITPQTLEGQIEQYERRIPEANTKQLLRLGALAALAKCTIRLAEWEAELPNTDWYPIDRIRALRSLALEKLRGVL